MTDGAWHFDELDADTRQRLVAEAAAQGLSVPEYLVQVLQALAEADRVPQEFTSGQIEPDPAAALGHALDAFDTGLRSLRRRIADIEDVATARNDRHDEAGRALADKYSELEERLDQSDITLRQIGATAAQAAAAQASLRDTLANEFDSFAARAASRIEAALFDVRAAADSAAEQAETSAVSLIEEMRSLRESLDNRLAESAGETKKRMQLAFAESQARISALAERVGDNDRAARTAIDGLRILIAESEENTRAAIEAGLLSVRHANATLAAENGKSAEDNRRAVEDVQARLLDDIQKLREQHASLAARQRSADAAIENADAELAALRQALTARDAAVDALGVQAQLSVKASLAELAERQDAQEEHTAERIRAAYAETERVEACTLASLSKLAGDIASVRAEHGATLDRMEAAMKRDALDPSFEQRLARLEAAAETVVSAHAVEAIRLQLAELRGHLLRRESDDALPRRVEELAGRLAASEALSSEAIERLGGVANAIDDLSAQRNETALATEERLRSVERAMSALARSIDEKSGPAASQHALMAVETRMAEIELAQASALDSIRDQLAAFIDANNRRLEALEFTPALTDVGEVASQFEALREHLEHRISYIESRSVRALEQVADTMGVLEARFGRADRRTA